MTKRAYLVFKPQNRPISTVIVNSSNLNYLLAFVTKCSFHWTRFTIYIEVRTWAEEDWHMPIESSQ